jgi:hypothetical protein
MTKTNRLSLIGNTPHEALWFLFKCHRPQSLIPHHFCVSRHEVKITYYNPRVCPRKITGREFNLSLFCLRIVLISVSYALRRVRQRH